MTFKELIDEISLENDIKRGKVRKITNSLLDKIVQKLESKEVIRTPAITFRPVQTEDANRLGFLRKVQTASKEESEVLEDNSEENTDDGN